MKFRNTLKSGILKGVFLILAIFALNTPSVKAQYPVRVEVNITPPVTPYLPQLMGDLRGGGRGSFTKDITNKLHVTLNNTGSSQKHLKLSGKIERISPQPMKISLRPGYTPPQPLILNPGQTIQANQSVLNKAFGNFYKNDLLFTNTSLSRLRSGANYKLPEGTYRICISAYNYDKAGMTGPLSAPGTGCATFNICYKADAPQLILPVSTLGEQGMNSLQKVYPKSPMITFAWTPARFTCGGSAQSMTYDLEIRRVFEGQTIQDALFNPPVFTKENLHRANFLLDTVRYADVLQNNNRYIVQVHANKTSTLSNPVEISNQGYSEIGYFVYNPSRLGSAIREDETKASKTDKKEYAGKSIKGRVTWAFKKSEESYTSSSSGIIGSEGEFLSYTGQGSGSQSIRLPSEFYGSNSITVNHATKYAKRDQTLDAYTQGNAAGDRAIDKNQPAAASISSSAAQQVSYEYLQEGTTKASNHHPLEGATIKIIGISGKQLVENKQNTTKETPKSKAEDIAETNPKDRKRTEKAAENAAKKLPPVDKTGVKNANKENNPPATGKDKTDQQRKNVKHVRSKSSGSRYRWKGTSGYREVGSSSQYDFASPLLFGRGTKAKTNDNGIRGRGANPLQTMPATPVLGPSPLPVSVIRNRALFSSSTNLQPNNPDLKYKRDTVLLATAKSGKDGYFNFEFTDPKFSFKEYEKLLVKVSYPGGFYNYTKTINVKNQNDKDQINLGELVMLANTFRLQANVHSKNVEGVNTSIGNAKMSLYVRSSQLQAHPYLKQEGNIPAEEKKDTTINGKNFTLVSVSGNAGNGNHFKFGKLFYTNYFYAVVTSSEPNVKDLYTDVVVSPQKVSSSTVVLAKTNYETIMTQPAIEGKVVVYAGDNSVAIKDAIVKVTYNEEDVVSTGSKYAGPEGWESWESSPTFSHFDYASLQPQELDYSIVGTSKSIQSARELEKPSFSMPQGGVEAAGLDYTFNHHTLPVVVNSQPAIGGRSTVQKAFDPNKSIPTAATDRSGGIPTVQTAFDPEIFKEMFSDKEIESDETMPQYKEANSDESIFMDKNVMKLFLGTADNGGGYTVRTDESGYFYVGNLPTLKEGAKFTITLISVPERYKTLPVNPEDKKFEVSVVPGQTEHKEFAYSTEYIDVHGIVKDAYGDPLPNAHLHFKHSDTYFYTNENGKFQTTSYVGTHTLIVEKEGYKTEEGKIRIPFEQGKPIVDTPLSKEYLKNKPAFLGEEESGNKQPTLEDLLKNPNGIPEADLGRGKHHHAPPGGFGPARRQGLPNHGKGITNGGMTPTDVKRAALSTPPKDRGDLGNIGFLEPQMVKVKFVVKDEDSHEPIEDVMILIHKKAYYTDENGELQYRGLGGHPDVAFLPSNENNYVPKDQTFDFKADNKLKTVIVYLEHGVRLYGKVYSHNKPIKDASVSIPGERYLSTITGERGRYTMYVPEGEWKIRAAKSGYMVHYKKNQFRKGQPVRMDFELEDGGGVDIGNLLGFHIELENRKELSSGKEVWSGSFVNVTPFLSVFKPDGDLTLPFNNIKVSIDEDGNAIPQGDSVLTDKNSLPISLFGYVPLLFKNNDNPIVVKKNQMGWGSISGQIVLDPSRILGRYDLDFLEGFLPQIIAQKRETPGSIEIFLGEKAKFFSIGQENAESLLHFGEEVAKNGGSSSNNNGNGKGGNLKQAFGAAKDVAETASQYVVDPAKLKFRLAPVGSDPVKIALYGFQLSLDLANTTVSPDGISLAGEIVTPPLPGIDTFHIPFDELTLSPKFKIKKLIVPESLLPSFEIGDEWRAELTALEISRAGLKMDGDIKLKIPNSDSSKFIFKDLRISKNGLRGGKFSIPEDAPFDLFGVAQISTPNQLQFGSVPDKKAYFLRGSAEIKFSKIFDKTIELESFKVRTDGKFMVKLPVDYKYDFGFAKYHFTDFKIANPDNQMPFVKLYGTFNADLSVLDFDASGFKFQAKRGGGLSLQVDSIGASLNVPVMECGLGLSLVDDGNKHGFGGGGSFAIPGAGGQLGAKIGFHYYESNNGGFDVGAEFEADIPLIIGVVEIDKVEGGFTYAKNDDGSNYFRVHFGGDATIPGMGSVVALTDVDLSVETGPIVEGHANISVGNVGDQSFTLAKASMELNFPGHFFDIDVLTDLSPMKDIATIHLDGKMKLSWQKNNTYVFAGVNAEMDLLSIVHGEGQFAIGYNVPMGDNSVKLYFSEMDPRMMSDNTAKSRFSGVYLHGGVHVGFGVDIGATAIAEVSAYGHYDAGLDLLLNFSTGDYGLAFGGSVGAKAEVRVLKMDVAGAGFDGCYSVAGGRRSDIGWYFDAAAAFDAYVEVNPGDVGCNAINWSILPGFKVCVAAHVSVDYQQRGSGSGLSFSGGLGHGNGQKCKY